MKQTNQIKKGLDLFKDNKLKMEDKNIFIHIPKTGGTTINTAMHNVYWQTKMDFNYRHFNSTTKSSTCGDIFNPLNIGPDGTKLML